MDSKGFPRVRKEALRKGWRVEPTRSGEMFYSRDGIQKVAWHAAHASSDERALDAFVRQMRKGGFRWPPPKER